MILSSSRNIFGKINSQRCGKRVGNCEPNNVAIKIKKYMNYKFA